MGTQELGDFERQSALLAALALTIATHGERVETYRDYHLGVGVPAVRVWGISNPEVWRNLSAEIDGVRVLVGVIGDIDDGGRQDAILILNSVWE